MKNACHATYIITHALFLSDRLQPILLIIEDNCSVCVCLIIFPTRSKLQTAPAKAGSGQFNYQKILNTFPQIHQTRV